MNLTHFGAWDSLKSTCESHTFVNKVPQKNVVGPTIKRIRKSLIPKVSQQDLAGRLAARGLQIDRSAVARLEAWTRYIRDVEIIAIAAALKVPIESIFSIER